MKNFKRNIYRLSEEIPATTTTSTTTIAPTTTTTSTTTTTTIAPTTTTTTAAPASIYIATGTPICRSTGNCNDNATCGIIFPVNITGAPVGYYVEASTVASSGATAMYTPTQVEYTESNASGSVTIRLDLYDTFGGTIIASTQQTITHQSSYPFLTSCSGTTTSTTTVAPTTTSTTTIAPTTTTTTFTPMDFTYTTSCSGVDGYVTITSITGGPVAGQDQYSINGSTWNNYNGSPVTVGPFSYGTNPTIYVRTDQGGLTSKNTGVVSCTTVAPTTTTTTTVAPAVCTEYTVSTSSSSGQSYSYTACDGTSSGGNIGGAGGYDADTFCAQTGTVTLLGSELTLITNSACTVEPTTTTTTTTTLAPTTARLDYQVTLSGGISYGTFNILVNGTTVYNTSATDSGYIDVPINSSIEVNIYAPPGDSEATFNSQVFANNSSGTIASSSGPNASATITFVASEDTSIYGTATTGGSGGEVIN
jgi:hypothetical protein